MAHVAGAVDTTARTTATALSVHDLGRKFAGRFGLFAHERLVCCVENRFRFVARLDQLPLRKILLGVFDRLLKNPLDLGIIEAVAWLDLDRMLLSGAQVARGNLQNSAGVNQIFHFDAREARGAGGRGDGRT